MSRRELPTLSLRTAIEERCGVRSVGVRTQATLLLLTEMGPLLSRRPRACVLESTLVPPRFGPDLVLEPAPRITAIYSANWLLSALARAAAKALCGTRKSRSTSSRWSAAVALVMARLAWFVRTRRAERYLANERTDSVRVGVGSRGRR